ncbi:MAG: class I SAM-dependent methyltransferase [Legionellales bacterium]|nr:class I SAM-dependent methyltransferase [Legionellales bacterium]
MEIDSHYSRIGSVYDNTGIYSSIELLEWFRDKIIDYLKLSQNDKLCDIGGGTGKISNMIDQKIKFKSRIVCVDPSIEMLKYTKKYNDRIIPLNMDAIEFIQNKCSANNNVFLLKEAIHHVDDLDGFFEQLEFLINGGRRALIITRPTMKGFPFFKSALELLNLEAENFISKLKLILLNSRLTVSINTEIFIHEISKELFIDMVERKIWSTLHNFDDAQIQDGIKEIQNMNLGDKMFKIPDYFLFINLSKLT